MQYLQNELLTSILCQIEPDLRHLKFVFDLKKRHFSFFHTPISRNSLDLDKQNWHQYILFFRQFLCVPNLKPIGGGPCKNGQKSVDLAWNDPAVTIRQQVICKV